MFGSNKTIVAVLGFAIAVVALSTRTASAQGVGAYAGGYPGGYGYGGSYYGGYDLPSPPPPSSSTNQTVQINNFTALANQLRNGAGSITGAQVTGIAVAAAISAVVQLFL